MQITFRAFKWPPTKAIGDKSVGGIPDCPPLVATQLLQLIK